MSNVFYTATGNPATGSTATSATMRAEFASIVAAFDKMPVPTGNSGKHLIVDPTSSFLTVSSAISESAGVVTITGATVLAAAANIGGAPLATTTGSQTLTNKTLTNPVINGFTGDTSVVNIGSGQFYKDASGVIGVGTASPSERMQIHAASGDSQIKFSNATSGSGFVGVVGSTYGAGTSGDVRLYAAAGAGITLMADNAAGIVKIATGGNTERMRIDASGNVGVGTSSPSTVLDVRSVTVNPKFTSTTGTNGAWATFANTGGNFYVGAENSTGSTFTTGAAYAGVVIANGANPLILGTNAAERMRIDASGNVGIGDTTPTASGAALSVITTGATYNALVLGDTAAYNATPTAQVHFRLKTTSGGAFANVASIRSTKENTTSGDNSGSLTFFTSSASTQAERMRIDSTGVVKVGNATTMVGTGSDGISAVSITPGLPSTVVVQNNSGPNYYASKVTGYSSNQFMSFNVNGSNVGLITTNGTTTTYATSSDARLKKNVAAAQDSGAVIDAVQVVEYDWKANDAHVTHGVIAQQLHEVFPDAVVKGNDGEEITDPWGVDFSHMVPLLIKELQTVRARLAALENA